MRPKIVAFRLKNRQGVHSEGVVVGSFKFNASECRDFREDCDQSSLRFHLSHFTDVKTYVPML